MRQIIILSFLLFTFGCTPEVIDSASMASITVPELQKHVNYLASDQLRGRKTGTSGYMAAARYAAKEFESYGLQPLTADSGEAENPYFHQVPLAKVTLKAKSRILLSSSVKGHNHPGRAQYFSAPNVVGFLPGTDQKLKNEFIVVCAHLDHLGVIDGKIYNGANDNASGCAVVLEAAEALALKPGKRSVIFVLFCGEEEGLLGSRYFVKSPPVELKGIVACLNIDHAARWDNRLHGILAAGSDLISPALKEKVKRANGKAGVSLDFNQRKILSDHNYKGSDHYPFHQAGIPSVVFSTLGFKGYHTPQDDAHLLDFGLNYRVARITYATLRELADNSPH